MAQVSVAYLLTAVHFGGSDRVNLNFLRHVDRKKFRICPIILVRPWEKDNFLIQELNKDGYSFYTVPVSVKRDDQGRDYFRVFRCYARVHSLLKQHRFQVIHSHGYFADLIGIPLAKLLRIPSMATCHGFISNDWKCKLYNNLDLAALRFADRIIAVSDEIKNILLQRGIRQSNIVLIQNAVDARGCDELSNDNRREKRLAYKLGEGDFIIGFIGRLSQEKGVTFLLEAARTLRGSCERLRLLIIGDGPQREELEKQLQRKGLQDFVIFVGFQRNVEAWLPALDILVLPSLTEGTPMALLEAMACGVPVIASSVGGIPNIIENGVNGVLVTPGEKEEIVCAIRRLYQDRSMMEKISEEGRRTIRVRHNLADWTMRIEREYSNIVGKV